MTSSRVVLPIYFVADQSKSMTNVIGEVNRGLVELLNAMQLEPMAASRIRFGIVGFSDHPTVYLEPSDLREISYMPFLKTGGRTSYSQVFEHLYAAIPKHVERLRASGLLVTRPSVFFLTDGQPTDPPEEWRTRLAALHADAFPLRPNMLAFGVGPKADPAIIREVATNDAFAMVSASGTDIGAALATFADSLTHSVVASGQALASGVSELPVMKPEGFVLAIDILD